MFIAFLNLILFSDLKKIILLLPWFGKWPWYTSYFIHSCRFNSSVDFIILSDTVLEIELPPNIIFKKYTMNLFVKKASKALGFQVNIKHSYKICDFKPAYGYIFADIVKEYDFWGYCDIDIIFGNIRRFMTDEVLIKYDLISARHDYLTGCFALYKNIKYINELFMQSKDYKTVFTNPENFCFDETNYAFEAFGKGLNYNFIDTEIESMTHVVKRVENDNNIKAYFDFQIIEGYAGNMIWENGKLVYRNKFEVLCYHMVKFKTKYSEQIDFTKKIPNKFRIGKKKIYYK